MDTTFFYFACCLLTVACSWRAQCYSSYCLNGNNFCLVIDYTLMSNPHVKSYANPPLPQFFFVVSLFWYNVAEDETVSNLKKGK